MRALRRVAAALPIVSRRSRFPRRVRSSESTRCAARRAADPLPVSIRADSCALRGPCPHAPLRERAGPTVPRPGEITERAAKGALPQEQGDLVLRGSRPRTSAPDSTWCSTKGCGCSPADSRAHDQRSHGQSDRPARYLTSDPDRRVVFPVLPDRHRHRRAVDRLRGVPRARGRRPRTTGRRTSPRRKGGRGRSAAAPHDRARPRERVKARDGAPRHHRPPR